MKNYFIFAVILIGVSIILKIFIFSVFSVVSESMSPTLYVGDVVVVKKNYSLKPKKLLPDITVFIHPKKSDNKKFIKRCVGYPGDTIELVNGFLKRNGQHVLRINSIYKKEVNITSESDYRIKFLSDKLIFPANDEFKHSILNFGPVVIPKAGMKIVLNHKNRILYNSIIMDSTKSIWDEYYNVERNYYFVMGDNYFGSIDSRFWGFLPEENIIGKATLVLFNYHKGKFRWDRFFKKIE